MGNSWNREFRDMSAEANYPFTAGSSLAYNDTVLDTGFILDMLLYPVEARVMPYHLSAIRGGNAESEAITLVIKDLNYDIVCTFTPSHASDAAPGLDAYGRTVGIVTYDQAKLLDMEGRVGFGEFNFEKENAEICAGCCWQIPVKGTLGVTTQAGGLVSGAVNIVAANGLKFTVVGSDARLDMYGEMRTLAMPLKKINNIAYDHYWLAAHPDSSVRVVTRPADKAVTVGLSRNFTYEDQTRNG